MRLTRASIGVLVGATTLIATSLNQSNASAAPPSPSSAGGTERVIVVLADQLPGTPVAKNGMADRVAKAAAAQNAVLARVGGKLSDLVHYSVGNAFAATVTVAQADAFAADPSVAYVVKDTSVAVQPSTPPAVSPSGGSRTTSNSTIQPNADGPTAICPTDPSQPLLEPEALQTIHARTTDGSPYAQQLTTGEGVKVAYIADGIDPDNPDFIRPDGSHVIVDYQDFSGDGPNAPSGGGEAFGDASAIAAQGTLVHDLSNFVNPAYPLPAGCNIRILGVAPGASIVALKAGGEFLTNSSILQSIDYAVRVQHVDVINESFGLNEFPDSSSRNAVQLFNDQAVAAGISITESSGDGGVTGTIGSDAQDPEVISAGATTDSRLYAQTGYAGARFFGNGAWVDSNISALSSSGVTQFGRTIDLVAPGEADWAVCEPNFASCTNFRGGHSDIEAFGGTSQSSPLTAGVAALVISAYRSTHGGTSPGPIVVKQIITSTTDDLGLPADEQGSGLLDARAAVEAALTWPGSRSRQPSSVASNIAVSTNQVTLTGDPGTTQYRTVKVTNVGNRRLTISGGTRGYSNTASASQTIAFSSTAFPTFPYPTTGAPWAYKKVTFTVPSGTSRLVTQTAWEGSRPPAADAIVRVSLFAPDGTYEANSRPQGGAATPNYANVDVRNPQAGTWTAVFYSPAGAAGYSGNILFGTTDQRSVSVGNVFPANFSLDPGESRNVVFGFRLPSTASGDQPYSVTLATSAGRKTSVSAIVRTLIPTSRGGQYSGVLTGGNARNVTPGETLSYEFTVPSSADSLMVTTTFPHNTDSPIDLVLIDPNGELSDVVSNETVNDSETALTLTQNLQSITADPVPGLWHMVIVAQNPVSGEFLTQPFSGRVSFTRVPVHAGGLPNSSFTRIRSGSTATYTVAVTNPGVQPIFVGVDPRLNTFVNLQPVPIGGQPTFALPPDPNKEPVYTIPPDTKSLTVSATSTTPAQLELQGSAAGFDIFGDLAAAQHGSLVSTASVHEFGDGNYISRGIWFTNMQQIGPFTDAGAPPGSTTITASMRTLQFDSAVTSSTGDPYGNSVDPNNDGFDNPVEIMPGETQNITVAISPTAPRGTEVSGVLNLVTLANLPTGSGGLPFYSTGEVIRAIPYEYRVG